MVYWTSTVLPGRLYVSGSAPLHVLSTPFLSLSVPLMSLPTKLLTFTSSVFHPHPDTDHPSLPGIQLLIRPYES